MIGSDDDEEREEADDRESAERAFVAGVVARGEAAPAGAAAEGELPPGVTHEIVEQDGDEAGAGEQPTLRRRRFSAY